MIGFNFENKTVLVTGSTQGIGLDIAKSFVECGAKVFVHCSGDIEKAKRVQAEIGAYGAVVADLSDMELTAALPEKTGDIDILVLNASVQIRNDWDKITLDEFDKQVNVNYKSTLLLMQKYYPAMKEKGWGRIITIGSVQQVMPHKQMAVYASTKSAVVNLVHNVAKQVAPEGITVNNVAPGTILTPRNEGVLSDPEYRAKCLESIPVGFFGECPDISGTVLLVASEYGRFITGQDILIDGGAALR